MRWKSTASFGALPPGSFPTAYGDFIWNRADAETRAAAIATFIIEVVLCTKGSLFAGGEQKLKRANIEIFKVGLTMKVYFIISAFSVNSPVS